MIDVNVYLDRWPFRRLPHDGPAALVRTLRDQGVTEAWAGSFDAVLHRDVAGVNSRLAVDCQRYGEGLLKPFGTVNPTLPDWQEDLRRCHEQHKMPGIRLHPNYHSYSLEHPSVGELLRTAADRGLIVQIALKMEDERTQHPLVRVPPVDPAPLLDVLPRIPKLRLVLLNAMRDIPADGSRRLREAGSVFFETAMMEGVGGVGHLVRTVGEDRILLGSYFPFLVFESAALKLKESGLSPETLERIRVTNARRLLERA